MVFNFEVTKEDMILLLKIIAFRRNTEYSVMESVAYVRITCPQ
jgi:hypothetical protein